MASTATSYRHRRFVTQYFKPRLIRDKLANQIPFAIILGHAGVFIAVALYFWFTQNGAVKPYWDHLFPMVWLMCLNFFAGGHYNALDVGHMPQWGWWVSIRHTIFRNAEESIWGGSLALLAFANALRPPLSSDAGPVSRFVAWLTGYGAEEDWFDRLAVRLRFIPNQHQGHRTTPLQYLLLPVSATVAAIPGIVPVALVFLGIPALLSTLKIHLHTISIDHTIGGTSLLDNLGNVWTTANIGKLIGAFGLFFYARRVFLKVGIDLQEHLSDDQAAHYLAETGALGHVRRFFTQPHWPLPATYRALFWHKVITGSVMIRRNRGARWMTMLIIPVMLYATYYGYTILK